MKYKIIIRPIDNEETWTKEEVQEALDNLELDFWFDVEDIEELEE